jgi:hypothetical protein
MLLNLQPMGLSEPSHTCALETVLSHPAALNNPLLPCTHQVCGLNCCDLTKLFTKLSAVTAAAVDGVKLQL